ncbi:MAG: peptide chain release factor N(5)-glutamine methyltransferase [Candidatus Falkowbacteria bacterium]
MIIKEALQYGWQTLDKNKTIIDNSALEAEILLASILKTSREHLLTHNEDKLNKFQLLKYKKLLALRLKLWPIAYLTGHKYFYGLDFFVNKNVLVPRPESEMMVDEILDIVNKSELEPEIIDLGTGSGCIIISLAKNLAPNIPCTGIDVSSAALSVAKKNAKNLEVPNVKFIKSNLLQKVLPILKYNNNKHLVIAANLPYLAPDWIKASPSIKHEPKLALVAGADGLKYYRILFDQIKTLSNPKITILCEIDPRQKETIAKLLEEKIPEATYQIKNDLAGLDRLVIIEMNSR